MQFPKSAEYKEIYGTNDVYQCYRPCWWWRLVRKREFLQMQRPRERAFNRPAWPTWLYWLEKERPNYNIIYFLCTKSHWGIRILPKVDEREYIECNMSIRGRGMEIETWLNLLRDYNGKGWSRNKCLFQSHQSQSSYSPRSNPVEWMEESFLSWQAVYSVYKSTSTPLVVYWRENFQNSFINE